MSWDQSGAYDDYGQYSHYGQYPDPNAGYYGQPETYPAQNPPNAGPPPPAPGSYGGYGGPPSPAPMAATPGPPASAGGYYNPNEYGQSVGGAPGNTAAYRSSPLPNQPQPQPQYYPHGQAPQQGQQPAGLAFPSMMGDPMVTNMAMQYGQEFMGKQSEEIKKNLDKYVSIGQLKYYFAVDTTYVAKKLGILLFPFTHSDWSIKYNQEEPVQPKFDINASDLYIPSMAYITYVLLVGYILGLRNAFSPDLLATTSSSALVWLILEIGMIYLSLTLMNISTNMSKWDILSFSTYKYVAMIFIVLLGLVFQSTAAYYAALFYSSGALAFFLVRALKLRIEPEVHGMQTHGKRKLYMILFYAGLQPFFIWWMTSYLVPISSLDIPNPMPIETY
ncbi:hypothetical protein TCAL_04620 [Tigriopus californicus]|uniref:Protein YIF1 n=1 Tax=Tigriopus californicus TaxID=6832 RepID=A0A553NFS8_TIGCA|nr:protein YIF1B-like isoform X2 [Tigriopus californicus]TRY64314.1 hypothetical protein TCAL_04620 [Tigriopus californicus]|eukprot:TCALIF_04620-PA protein Name:"Similar to yif1b-b Protein YIF1B-B (Xenopus laevis)" AED:0.17 eAED:0.17 QI:140/1/1/1/1/1/5/72/388